VIAGLGEKSDFVATVPHVDVARLDLTLEERELLERVGRATQIQTLIEKSGLPEAYTIALLLSLRAKGALVPAKVTKPPPNTGPTNAAALNEDVELSDERKRDILDMEVALETRDHFDVLGVSSTTSPDDIKKAFYELSRKFHPDKYFKKNLGSYRARVELVFRKLSHAYETVHDVDRRREYLRAHPGAGSAGDPMRTAGVSTPAPEKARPRTADDDVRDAERRARFSKHPYFAKGMRLNELVARAKEHMAQGDYGPAFRDLHMAHQIDAKNDEVNKLLNVVRAKNDQARAEAELKRGLDLLEQGNEGQALSAFRSASNIDSHSSKAAYMVAKLLWDKGDTKDATGYAQKAVDADPKNPDAHVMLARILDASGMKAMAKRHFDEALKINPKHSEAKKHVKGRWPF
jgi:curved DNA-binding protein CbpA